MQPGLERGVHPQAPAHGVAVIPSGDPELRWVGTFPAEPSRTAPAAA